MELKEAHEIAGHLVAWQLINFIDTHSLHPELNSPAQALMLKAARLVKADRDIPQRQEIPHGKTGF